MLLFFDTETTGLPKSNSARNHDVDNWPRLVQIAWAICNDDGVKLSKRNRIIKPEGFHIPSGASEIHGITDAIAEEDGIPLGFVLSELLVAVEVADTLVGHGVYFDKSVVGAEYIRRGKEGAYEKLKDLPRVCTMQKSTKYCKLPHKNGRKGYKWPKLMELHEKLFGVGFEDAHDAMADISATINCFFELKELKVF